MRISGRPFKKIFETSKKKDDLSDCYLQAVTYCTFKRLIPSTPRFTESINNFVKITKTQVKKDLTDFLTIQKELTENIQKYLIDNYLVSFPLDIPDLSKICSEFSLKRLFNSVSKT